MSFFSRKQRSKTRAEDTSPLPTQRMAPATAVALHTSTATTPTVNPPSQLQTPSSQSTTVVILHFVHTVLSDFTLFYRAVILLVILNITLLILLYYAHLIVIGIGNSVQLMNIWELLTGRAMGLPTKLYSLFL